MQGFKARVGADAETSLVKQIAVTSANINDGLSGPDVLPSDLRQVFVGSAYRALLPRACGDEQATRGKINEWNQPVD